MSTRSAKVERILAKTRIAAHRRERKKRKIKYTKYGMIFTDGSCQSNGNGGYAALINTPDGAIVISGGFANTKSTRMEMKAAIEGIKKALSLGLHEKYRLRVISDSAFLVNGINIYKDKKNHKWDPSFKLKGKRPRHCPDLWQELWSLCQQTKIDFSWIKGHNGHDKNEFVDQLSRQESLRKDLMPERERK